MRLEFQTAISKLAPSTATNLVGVGVFAFLISHRRTRKELCNHNERLAEVKELNDLQAKQALLDIGGVRFHTSFESKIPFSFCTNLNM